MNIQTSYNVMWTATDQDTYDGAEDSNCPIGHGRTEREAINHLVEQLVDQGYSEGWDAAFKEAVAVVARAAPSQSRATER